MRADAAAFTTGLSSPASSSGRSAASPPASRMARWLAALPWLRLPSAHAAFSVIASAEPWRSRGTSSSTAPASRSKLRWAAWPCASTMSATTALRLAGHTVGPRRRCTRCGTAPERVTAALFASLLVAMEATMAVACSTAGSLASSASSSSCTSASMVPASRSATRFSMWFVTSVSSAEVVCCTQAFVGATSRLLFSSIVSTGKPPSFRNASRRMHSHGSDFARSRSRRRREYSVIGLMQLQLPRRRTRRLMPRSWQLMTSRLEGLLLMRLMRASRAYWVTGESGPAAMNPTRGFSPPSSRMTSRNLLERER
mmetsp:Transcript_7089/g.14317  ORF Transcript_7089/g.14317 Transcript_7089/m.14317 type:complete len:312 (+) Transcript_7089:236-1171(+)